MIKKLFLLLGGLLLSVSLPAQQAYFQQEVNYKIDLTLDDQAHRLSGNIEMEYINNSPNELPEIYLHLWANAYKNRQTAFARQQLQTGSTRFYFAKDKYLGNFSKLDFRVNGNSCEWTYDPQHPDIAILKLDSPLPSGGKIIISTPFDLKIPGSFSRLGHVGQSYQMTQWYPKPAVYDRDGWHPMPYLDMGEFYSEFGDYEVSITLPDNYVVGATGVLETESEYQFLEKKATETEEWLSTLTTPPLIDTFPASSPNTKTLRYRAKQVHDFAWFADKRFYVQKSAVKLASGKKVDTWTMFTNAEADLWKESITYVDRSVKFYSEKVGEYPYPQATAVQSALSAGGGMEYPMITVIGLSGNAQALDEVITHEVGHNWFYGILAFDERDHPWLDEGLNSYYDHRYTEQYYGSAQSDFLPEFLMKSTDYDFLDLAYLFQARRNQDQAPETSSADFERINYFLGAYEKPARIFRYLEKYLSTAKFDRIMQGFYQKWQFKHPQPEDLREYVEKESDKNLDWLFDGLINSNAKIDYAFGGMQSNGDNLQLTVINKGDLAAPFPVSGLQDGKIVSTQWYEGFKGKQKVEFLQGGYDQIVIDEQRYTLDKDRKNNNLKTKGILKTVEPLRFQFLTGLENSKRTSIYWAPLLSWNNYDKTMLGLALYNTSLPANRFEFALAPQYSFVTKEVSGLANVKYNLFPNSGLFRKVTFDLGWKSYHYNYNWPNDYYLKYHRLSPNVSFEFRKKPANSNLYQRLHLRSLLLWQETPDFSPEGAYQGNEVEDSWIKQLIYEAENRRVLHPYHFIVSLEQQNYESAAGQEHYLKASLEANLAYTYQRGKNIHFRIFAGGFLDNSRRDAGSLSNLATRGTYALTSQGFNDYQFDDFYFGRSDQSGIWSHQISLRDGGMKNAFSSAFGLGQSNNYILALNIKADLPPDLPLNIPLKPYFDLGYFDNATPTGQGASISDQLLYSGGLMLDFFDGIIGVYFPLINSENMDIPYQEREDGKFIGRVTFSLDFHRLNPWRAVDRIRF